MKTLWRTLILLAPAAFLPVAGSAAHAATIRASNESAPGLLSAVQVTVGIEGLAAMAAPSLGAFDLTVQYDPSLLALASTDLGTQLDQGAGSFAQITPAAGSINVLEASFDAPAVLDAQQDGAFTLAVFTFLTLDFGVSPIDFGTVVLSDAAAAALPVTAVGGSVAIGVVPEPGTVALLGVALASTVAFVAQNRRSAG